MDFPNLCEKTVVFKTISHRLQGVLKEGSNGYHVRFLHVPLLRREYSFRARKPLLPTRNVEDPGFSSLLPNVSLWRLDSFDKAYLHVLLPSNLPQKYIHILHALFVCLERNVGRTKRVY